MSDPSIDVLPSLSTTSDHVQTAPPTSSGGLATPSSKSLLDDWENWPENDPNFDPTFHNGWSLREPFCGDKNPECVFCSETRQILHISECTANGQMLMDKKVNAKELRDHLRELERLHKSDVKAPDHPSVRMFFACGNFGHDSMRFAYMRQFLAYCRLPAHFSLRINLNDSLPVFQAAYEPTGSGISAAKPQRGILHIYLQSLTPMHHTDIRANPEYYNTELQDLLRERTLPGFTPIPLTVYIRYDESSRESDVYVTDDTRTFHRIRSILSGGSTKSKPGVREANQDPFLLVGVFLQHRVADLHAYARAMRGNMVDSAIYASKLTSLDTDLSALFMRFEDLGVGGPDGARMAQEAASMLRALGEIEAEHRRFLAREGIADVQAYPGRMIRQCFQQQRAHLMELEASLSAMVKGIEIVKDLMTGRAQILNGIEMAKMARDSQTQAAATEALALDARRDSEIMKRDSATMKTITVVTLVYLPATFVSTLLSMGLFDFGVGDGGNGRLRVAREGWVFLAISLPLTILTLGLAYTWKQYKERQWTREAEETKAKANAATQQQEKSTAGNGDGAPQVPEPEPQAAVNAAPASRWQPVLARLPHMRRRPAPQETRGSGTETV